MVLTEHIIININKLQEYVNKVIGIILLSILCIVAGLVWRNWFVEYNSKEREAYYMAVGRYAHKGDDFEISPSQEKEFREIFSKYLRENGIDMSYENNKLKFIKTDNGERVDASYVRELVEEYDKFKSKNIDN